MSERKVKRREFIATSAVTAAAIAGGSLLTQNCASVGLEEEKRAGEEDKRGTWRVKR